MADSEKMVKVPEDMFRQMERRAMRATELEQALLIGIEALKGYEVVAVVTSPTSGADATKILAGIRTLVTVARDQKL